MQDATEIYKFTPDPGMPIPTENQFVTLQVKHPSGFGEQQKDYRIVEVRHSFSGVERDMSGQIVHVVVTDLEE